MSTVELPHGLAPVRDIAAALEAVRRQWGGRSDLWVFGYASLIWKPEFEVDEAREALVHGWHRALRMRSRVNRGTPQEPGLVFALLPGGACRGFAYRVKRHRAEEELQRLWLREMPTGVYDPRFLRARTRLGDVPALTFTLRRGCDSHLPHLSDAQLLHIFRHACGRFGTTLDYLHRTAQALHDHGIRDREINRMVALATQHGLLPCKPGSAEVQSDALGAAARPA